MQFSAELCVLCKRQKVEQQLWGQSPQRRQEARNPVRASCPHFETLCSYSRTSYRALAYPDFCGLSVAVSHDQFRRTAVISVYKDKSDAAGTPNPRVGYVTYCPVSLGDGAPLGTILAFMMMIVTALSFS